jgi:hypothetical protein
VFVDAKGVAGDVVGLVEGKVVIIVVVAGIVDDGVGLTTFVGIIVEVGVRMEVLAGSLDPQVRIETIIIAAIMITIRIIKVNLPLPFIATPPFKVT